MWSNLIGTAGGVICGYVSTTFGARDINDAKADIDKYFDTLFAGYIDGVFFDEMQMISPMWATTTNFGTMSAS